jgi:GMP synthase-like glutamine amidotransferase
MRALLLANAADTDGGFTADRFRHHGYAFTECHREIVADWPSLDGHELVLTLGSEWSVYWPHLAHPVAAEAALIADAHDRGIPVYGICYGNQIMSHALGGTVERAREPEIGWRQIVSDEPEAISEGPWMQWHYDVITVPPGAEELARSAVGPQAWRMGRSSTELIKHGIKPDELMDETRRNVVDSQPAAEHLVDWYLNSVAGS